MEDIDLNENNYNYQQLLNLFSLDDDFNINDLKIAKRKVLKLHPDKCNLNIKYFLFFMKMFKKVEQIYNYTHHETNIYNYKKEIDVDDHFKKYLEQNNIDPRKNYKQFSREFNKMFENVYIKENQDGYDDWLKSDEGVYDKDDLEGSRKKAIHHNSLIKKDELQEVGGNYDAFSRLKCFDVKESHNNTIFAYDVEEEYRKKPKFKSVQEYQHFIAKEDEKNQPIGLNQSKALLHKREEMLHNQAKHLAFDKMSHSNAMNEKYNSYISQYLKLEN